MSTWEFPASDPVDLQVRVLEGDITVSAVATQATADAAVGIIFGIPLGIALGRELWTLFARNINAVPDPTVPVLAVGVIALATLVFANVIALVPGRNAARTSTALALHAE